ncbi:cell division cycle protein 123 homolog [Schistocerca gregaria]|uniref:cell division cycle protein 123 homolog n=1 Tax=Schistocerca gregaria TaxID=7010 RepID=UPI00211EAE4F|nr:cell division cycle protein 123 homolog [Schistocerca gregaria]
MTPPDENCYADLTQLELYEQLWTCSIAQWYKNPNLARITFPTRFLSLSDAVVRHLLDSEGIFLDAQCDIRSLDPCGDDSDDEWSKNPGAPPSQEEESSDSSVNRKRLDVPEETKERIKAALKMWASPGKDGGIFVKCFWSSALDARWIIPCGTLKCTTTDEVLLAIQASDRIRSDLELFKKIQSSLHSQEAASAPQLALRKWHNVNTSMEFRCFVKHHELIAISQKQISECWLFLSKEKKDIESKIIEFWQTKLADHFPLDSYVFDTYIHSRGSVWLVDISPYHADYTDPLLWTWEEIDALTNVSHRAELRVVEEQGIVPNLFRMTTGLPYDLLQMEEIKQLQFDKLIDYLKNLPNPKKKQINPDASQQ